MYKNIVACLFAFVAVTPAFAQQHSPYVGFTEREIKTLSPQETADYLSGKGMRLSLAAELNRFPGPAHVRELADKLRLSSDQLERTEQIMAIMQREAVILGKALVEKEKELDRLFSSREIRKAGLRSLMTEIGRLQGELRLVHLEAHFDQTAILTPEQIEAYDTLRGYRGNTSASPAQPHKHH